jgi:hypothetical protein
MTSKQAKKAKHKGWNKHDEDKVKAYCEKHGLDFDKFSD